jgi:putative membrane protein
MNEEQIYQLERPHPNLLKLYLIRSILTGPLAVILLPVLYFRYHTLRYNFDDEGVSMRWGILFRHEINLTYGRIQDIHVTAGFIQRWLGLADLQIQTASGSAAAEMTIEGFLEYEAIRDFLYAHMRGYRQQQAPAAAPGPAAPAAAGASDETLGRILTELRGTREALERLAARREGEA